MKLVGGETIMVSSDKVGIVNEVATTMGKVRGREEFLILDNDNVVMGVY